MQNLSQIGPVVWSVEGGAIDLAPAHLLLRAHLQLYEFLMELYEYWHCRTAGRASPSYSQLREMYLFKS